MQEDNHIFQGLRRDNHQIRQDAKFLWDAHNIRFTARDDNTLLSNEIKTCDNILRNSQDMNKNLEELEKESERYEPIK